eukprot:TRINITY_DN2307_c1_g1_i1.p1 TRINITY_DN2307_c1_g1~~TRINITY_DN2307_c1_g1_i1.p1  ORF type:complete len:825 (+),score=197.16 TRINITY_DN2307_c1_g1_i1:52-2475(+)
MGIPAFYAWLAQKYSRISRKHLPDGEMDNVYLDVNALIHGACQGWDGEYLNDEDKMLEKLIVYVERLLKVLGAKKLVYFAVDGVAPRAKLNQQRGRRFQSAKSRLPLGKGEFPGLFHDDDDVDQADVKDTLNELSDATASLNTGIFDKSDVLNGLMDQSDSVPSEGPCAMFVFNSDDEDVDALPPWDSNAITPGTAFMEKVSKTLNKWAEAYQGPATIIVSDSNTPGEGEHKFIDFIKAERQGASTAQSWLDLDDKHAIVSLDADILLLALSLHLPNVYVVREDRRAEGMTKFEYCFIDNLREQLAEELHGKIAMYHLVYHEQSALPQSEHPDFERLATDWVSLMTFAGNDFIPHLPAAYIGQLGGELFMDLYCRNMAKLYSKKTKEWKYLINADCSLNLTSFREFIMAYATVEDSLFRQEAIHEKVLTEEQALKASGFGSSVDDTWRDIYYSSVEEITGLSSRREMCKKWMEGFMWVVKYYVLPGTASWSWFYPYFHAPFAADLLDYLQEFEDEVFHVDFEKSVPLQPQQQLLAVLPKWSFSLLPDGYGEAFTSANAALYPTSWKFDLTGCRAEHHGVPVLPFLNIADLVASTRVTTPTQNTPFDVIYNKPPFMTFSSHSVQGSGFTVAYNAEDFTQIPKWHRQASHPEVKSVELPQFIPWRHKPTPYPVVLVSGVSILSVGVMLKLFLSWTKKYRRSPVFLLLVGILAALILKLKRSEMLPLIGGVQQGKKPKKARKKPAFLKPKRCRVDWVCSGCLCKNWERQEDCYKCMTKKQAVDLEVFLPKSNRWSTSCYSSNHLHYVEDQ